MQRPRHCKLAPGRRTPLIMGVSILQRSESVLPELVHHVAALAEPLVWVDVAPEGGLAASVPEEEV